MALEISPNMSRVREGRYDPGLIVSGAREDPIVLILPDIREPGRDVPHRLPRLVLIMSGLREGAEVFPFVSGVREGRSDPGLIVFAARNDPIVLVLPGVNEPGRYVPHVLTVSGLREGVEGLPYRFWRSRGTV